MKRLLALLFFYQTYCAFVPIGQFMGGGPGGAVAFIPIGPNPIAAPVPPPAEPATIMVHRHSHLIKVERDPVIDKYRKKAEDMVIAHNNERLVKAEEETKRLRVEMEKQLNIFRQAMDEIKAKQTNMKKEQVSVQTSGSTIPKRIEDDTSNFFQNPAEDVIEYGGPSIGNNTAQGGHREYNDDDESGTISQKGKKSIDVQGRTGLNNGDGQQDEGGGPMTDSLNDAGDEDDDGYDEENDSHNVNKNRLSDHRGGSHVQTNDDRPWTSLDNSDSRSEEEEKQLKKIQTVKSLTVARLSEVEILVNPLLEAHKDKPELIKQLESILGDIRGKLEAIEKRLIADENVIHAQVVDEEVRSIIERGKEEIKKRVSEATVLKKQVPDMKALTTDRIIELDKYVSEAVSKHKDDAALSEKVEKIYEGLKMDLAAMYKHLMDGQDKSDEDFVKSQVDVKIMQATDHINMAVSESDARTSESALTPRLNPLNVGGVKSGEEDDTEVENSDLEGTNSEVPGKINNADSHDRGLRPEHIGESENSDDEDVYRQLQVDSNRGKSNVNVEDSGDGDDEDENELQEAQVNSGKGASTRHVANLDEYSDDKENTWQKRMQPEQSLRLSSQSTDDEVRGANRAPLKDLRAANRAPLKPGVPGGTTHLRVRSTRTLFD